VAAFGLLALVVPSAAADAATPSASHAFCVEDVGEVIPPDVINKSEVLFAIEAAEIWFTENRIAGGTTTVDVLVGADGLVKFTKICRSSNNVYLDELGETIARMMRFEPARKRDTPVEAWITVPIQIAPGHRDPAGNVSLTLPLPKL
jgi:TonB family protein